MDWDVTRCRNRVWRVGCVLDQCLLVGRCGHPVDRGRLLGRGRFLLASSNRRLLLRRRGGKERFVKLLTSPSCELQ